MILEEAPQEEPVEPVEPVQVSVDSVGVVVPWVVSGRSVGAVRAQAGR
ncbi:hypothetical protein ACLQ2R_39780, partial [Streptosporangium sp. DT93]